MTRETLSRDHITKMAITLLDAEGVAGLSMRRLGHSLGGAATATYWHFQNKEDLLAAAADQVWSEVTFWNPSMSGWYEATRKFADETRSLFLRHQWLMPIMISYGVYGELRAAHQEHCYILLESAGFKGLALDAAVNTLLTFTFGIAFGESMDSTKAEQAVAKFLPLRNRMENRSTTDVDFIKKNNFEFGLATILNGFKAQLDN